MTERNGGGYAQSDMIKLFFAPRTRSVRIAWLLEELSLPYDLEKIEFAPPAGGTFSQQTPLGRLPVIEDDGMVMCESGAILEYLLEKYGAGRLAPPVGSPERGPFLQWMHYAEASLYPPVGVIIMHTLYKQNAAEVPAAIETAQERGHAALDFVRDQLGDKEYIVGDEFSAADIMLTFSFAAAQAVGVLAERHPTLLAYLERMMSRPAARRAMTI